MCTMSSPGFSCSVVYSFLHIAQALDFFTLLTRFDFSHLPVLLFAYLFISYKHRHLTASSFLTHYLAVFSVMCCGGMECQMQHEHTHTHTQKQVMPETHGHQQEMYCYSILMFWLLYVQFSLYSIACVCVCACLCACVCVRCVHACAREGERERLRGDHYCCMVLLVVDWIAELDYVQMDALWRLCVIVR